MACDGPHDHQHRDAVQADAYWDLTSTKSMLTLSGWPEALAAMIATALLAMPKRTSAAPPPTSDNESGVPSINCEIASGNCWSLTAGITLRKFQLRFLNCDGGFKPMSSTNCA